MIPIEVWLFLEDTSSGRGDPMDGRGGVDAGPGAAGRPLESGSVGSRRWTTYGGGKYSPRMQMWGGDSSFLSTSQHTSITNDIPFLISLLSHVPHERTGRWDNGIA